jgi:excisionase family DNA binding protein
MLSIGEASEYLNVSIDTLRRWEKKGRIVALRSPGGHRYFKKTELDQVFGTKYTRVEKTKAYRKKPEIEEAEAVEVTTIKKEEVVVQEQKQEPTTPRFVTEEVREVQIPPNVPIAIRTRNNNASASVVQSSSNILIPQIQTQAQMSTQVQSSTTSIPALTHSNATERPQNVNPQSISQQKPKEDKTTMIIVVTIFLTVILLVGIVYYFYTKSQILSPVP